MTNLHLFPISILFILLTFPSDIQNKKILGFDSSKETCGAFGTFQVSYCEIFYGIKSAWRTNSIAWSPEQSKNMTFDELKESCDNTFVCKENTGCFQDFVNYQFLDQCIDDVFSLGPMYFCDKTLRDILKKTPDQLSPCVKKHLENRNPEKFDCVSIKETGECFQPDIEKYCEPQFAKLYKEHQNLRLYNRACDGRLRYKDWDYSGTQDFGIQAVPGGIKVVDPKRNSSPNDFKTSAGLLFFLGTVFFWYM